MPISSDKHFDDLLEQVGGFGEYQKKRFLLLCLPIILPHIFIVLSRDLDSPIPHRCKLSQYDTFSLNTVDAVRIVEEAIPFDNNGMKSRCLIKSSQNETTKCDSWVYDTPMSTIITEFELFCERSRFILVVELCEEFGGLGYCIMGLLGDKYGRKNTLVFSLSLSVCASFGIVVTSNIYIFIILWAICSVGYNGAFLIAYVTGLESFSQTIRIIFGATCILMRYAFHFLLLAIRRSLRDSWRSVQLIQAILTVTVLGICCMIAESPRWLLSRGKIPECDAILQCIAKTNGKQVPTRRFSHLAIHPVPEKLGIKEMLLIPEIMKRLFILMFIQMVSSQLHNHVVSAHISRTTVVVIMASVGMAPVIPVLLAIKFGRRSMLIGCVTTLGIFKVLSAATVTSDGSPDTLILDSLCFIIFETTANLILVYGCELFPTGVRCFAMGLVFTAFQIGLIGTYLDTKYVVTERILIGIGCLLGGALLLMLPETQHKCMPDDVNDITETVAPVTEESNVQRVWYT